VQTTPADVSRDTGTALLRGEGHLRPPIVRKPVRLWTAGTTVGYVATRTGLGLWVDLCVVSKAGDDQQPDRFSREHLWSAA
jgi:hypothetical protein